MQEEKVDRELQVKLGLQLETMVRTEGWHQVLAPWLANKQKSFEQEILNATELKDFISAQQNINMIDKIFNFVKNGIDIGEGASQKLTEEN